MKKKFLTSHKFIYVEFKVFENSGVAVITDLPIIRACQLITDAVNITEEDPVYEVAHAVPTAGMHGIYYFVQGVFFSLDSVRWL